MSSSHSHDPLRTAGPASLPFDLVGLSQGFLPRLPTSPRPLPGQPTATHGGRAEELTDEFNAFCAKVLATIPRSDQRRWGSFYVRGLLTTQGRKTVTRMVQSLAAPPADQSLQQFVNQSPWDWQPVRRDLAAAVQQMVDPEAWVVQSTFFPKSGDQSVAVTRQFVPSLARLINCQAALSLWLAGGDAGSPVDWRLVLPARWANDAKRRAQVGLPPELVAEEQWECAVELVTGVAQRLQIPQRPVIMDLRYGRPGMAVTRLQERRISFLARVDSSSVIWSAAPSGPHTALGGPAGRLALRIVVVKPDGRLEAAPWPAPHRQPATGMAQASLRAIASAGQRIRQADRSLLLLAERSANEAQPKSLWVTSLVGTPLIELLRLVELGKRTAVDQERLSELGLTDFEGRSYRGWHHHVTLVSVAHAYEVARLAATSRTSRAG
jgi:SRSO17 transposase